MRLLVLATDPVDAAAVREALPGEDLDGAEVLVVSPAVNESRIAFLVSDSDEAIADAEAAGRESAEALDEAGAGRARTTTGDSEPLVALQDALATFPADRIVLFVGDDEHDLRAEAEERFSIPVTDVSR
jgi:glycine/D-amino acid oxidase-like deaminating enzyme